MFAARVGGQANFPTYRFSLGSLWCIALAHKRSKNSKPYRSTKTWCYRMMRWIRCGATRSGRARDAGAFIPYVLYARAIFTRTQERRQKERTLSHEGEPRGSRITLVPGKIDSSACKKSTYSPSLARPVLRKSTQYVFKIRLGGSGRKCDGTASRPMAPPPLVGAFGSPVTASLLCITGAAPPQAADLTCPDSHDH